MALGKVPHEPLHRVIVALKLMFADEILVNPLRRHPASTLFSCQRETFSGTLVRNSEYARLSPGIRCTRSGRLRDHPLERGIGSGSGRTGPGATCFGNSLPCLLVSHLRVCAQERVQTGGGLGPDAGVFAQLIAKDHFRLADRNKGELPRVSYGSARLFSALRNGANAGIARNAA